MCENRNATQSAMVYAYLCEHGSITPIEAMNELGCMRLGARIWELKHDLGLPIKTTEEKAVNRFGKTVRYARYELGGN